MNICALSFPLMQELSVSEHRVQNHLRAIHTFISIQRRTALDQGLEIVVGRSLSESNETVTHCLLVCSNPIITEKYDEIV